MREVLTTAVMMQKPDGVSINAMKTVLGDAVDWGALRAGLARAEEYQQEDGDITNLCETSCGAHNADWEQFVSECWMGSTRESERKSDEKYCRSNKKWYRVRWLEQKLQDILQWMRAAGVKKFGPPFRLSNGKMNEMKPWHVRKPGRETCMCRYHMEFEHFCDALRRWKQAAAKDLTEEQLEHCVECPANAQEMGKFLQCEKGPFGLYQPECSMRHRLECRKCKGKFDLLVSEVERGVNPTISFSKVV